MMARRRWLYPGAGVTGRRSVIAGVLSPLALFITAVMGAGLNSVQIVAVLFLVGVLLALGMFFAWLSPTPEEMLGSRYRTQEPEPEAIAPGPVS